MTNILQDLSNNNQIVQVLLCNINEKGLGHYGETVKKSRKWIHYREERINEQPSFH